MKRAPLAVLALLLAPATEAATMTDELQLELRVEGDELRLALKNPSARKVRVWDRRVSWGWSTVSLRGVAPDGKTLTLRAAPATFTVNFPKWIDIAPHGQVELRLRVAPPDWVSDVDAAPFRGVPLQVEVVLHIPPTPEATQHHVLVGEWTSQPILSRSPHRWLAPDVPRLP